MEARTTSGAVTARRGAESDDLKRRGLDAYAAELLGTLMLVFFVCTIVTYTSENAFNVTDWAVIGLLHFLVLAMLVYTLGQASGAHFNPAVTVTLAALRKIGPIDAAIYIVLQIIGAFLGVLLVKVLLNNEGDPVGYGATTLSPFIEGKALAGFLAELIGTFALMWAIMGVAVNPKGARDWAGFVIGGTLGFAVMAIGPLSGAGLNPARALAPSVIGGGVPVGEFLVAYVLGPLVGALLAGTLYSALILKPEDLDDESRAPIDTFSGEESRRDEGGLELPTGVDRPTTGTGGTEGTVHTP